ncbi:MAG: putative cobalamin synthesis protein [Patescibacteria group bacterium]|nr:MAG: putative cobalamin synthesis protein [Patescibacteria group bacterium]
MTNKIPTTVVSGFLGSGKTTIISNLIDTLQKQGEQVVYIKNEIGDADIDSKILEGKGIKTRELLNGCICCTIVGPFISSINEIVEKFSPDRIIIEASGAADPSALALMISSHPLLERDGVIGIIDVVNFNGYKDLSVTAQNQTKFTDLIIFNKIELADLQQKRAVVGYVRELNTHSPIIEAPNGKVDPTVVFGLNTSELNKLLSHTPKTHTNHIHKDEIQAFTLTIQKPTTLSRVENFLQTLPKNIFRAKGFVTVNQGEIYIFNTVGNRTTFAQAPNGFQNENKQGMLIFIGYHANELEADITKTLKRLLQ